MYDSFHFESDSETWFIHCQAWFWHTIHLVPCEILHMLCLLSHVVLTHDSFNLKCDFDTRIIYLIHSDCFFCFFFMIHLFSCDTIRYHFLTWIFLFSHDVHITPWITYSMKCTYVGFFFCFFFPVREYKEAKIRHQKSHGHGRSSFGVKVNFILILNSLNYHFEFCGSCAPAFPFHLLLMVWY